MNNIKLLDQNTINKIAAGEVIDRPASIVKELMENAIDAKATNVTVEIKDGGLKFIRITDNGIGIDKDDIEVAFLRHSTSKIKSVEDLISVNSLGFRGEALSSIAAVCQVELITKTNDSITGIKYNIEGGSPKSITEIGAPDGTTFIVRNIFFNTPARRKFLKTAQTEAGYISDIVEKIAMSHPEIAINFISNGQTKLHTSGNGNLKDVIYSIYGREIANNLIEINAENEYAKVTGFIGKPIISRGNRNYENYFINNRYIKSTIITKAIEEGVKPVMMQHKYPFTSLHISINQELLDVNVHPSKMELRFRNADELYPWLTKEINYCIMEKPKIPQVSLVEEKEEKNVNIKMPEPFEVTRINKNKILGDTEENIKEEIIKDEIIKEDITEEKVLIEAQINNNLISETVNYNVEKTSKDMTMNLFEDDFLTETARKKHKIIGQIFKTYWIVEYEDNLYIIDQHAAHEKVLFEKTMERLRNKEINSQMINPPIILNLSMTEAELLNKYIDNFAEIGFEIEEFGGQDFAVRAIPHDLYTLNSYEVLMNIVDTLSEQNTKLSSELITEKIASMSCKAAVKGNSIMSVQEADALIDELLNLENPFNCPHGRPTIIAMSKYELEKKFKRII